MLTLHEGARQLATQGFCVFPCQPRGKSPACDAGLHAATKDLTRIDRWWTTIPDLNVAIATGAVSNNVFVLDVDGEGGEASLRSLEQQHGILPPTVECITGKGRHCYFRSTREVRNSASQIGPGLDIRGDGGYVIAPPSIHPTGRPYAWSVDGIDAVAIAPDWLQSLIEANGKNGKPLEHWHRTLTAPIHEGERNNTLASITGKLLHCGLTDGILLYDLIACVNASRCVPPLAVSEVETIVISMIRTHLGGQQK
jgi:hypothetical protein